MASLLNYEFHADKRSNSDRFPEDFMFELTKEEFTNWRSQFVTSNSSDKMGLRYAPYVFTEQGVAMLSSVLNSPKAIADYILTSLYLLPFVVWNSIDPSAKVLKLTFSPLELTVIFTPV